jgi:uncharacterized membrane protein HdeD (DUF308 family)
MTILFRIKVKKDNELNPFHIFVIRAIIGVVIAVVITRAFYGSVHPAFVAGMAIIMVGLAYFAEYLRHRRNK